MLKILKIQHEKFYWLGMSKLKNMLWFIIKCIYRVLHETFKVCGTMTLLLAPRSFCVVFDYIESTLYFVKWRYFYEWFIPIFLYFDDYISMIIGKLLSQLFKTTKVLNIYHQKNLSHLCKKNFCETKFLTGN